MINNIPNNHHHSLTCKLENQTNRSREGSKDNFDLAIKLKCRQYHLKEVNANEINETETVCHCGLITHKLIGNKFDESVSDNLNDNPNQQVVYKTDNNTYLSSEYTCSNAFNTSSLDGLVNNFNDILVNSRITNNNWQFRYIDNSLNNIDLSVSKIESGSLVLSVNTTNLTSRNMNCVFNDLNYRLIKKGWKATIEYTSNTGPTNLILITKDD